MELLVPIQPLGPLQVTSVNAESPYHQAVGLLDSLPQHLWTALKWSKMQIQEDILKTLIDIWPSLKDRQEQDVKWGDEIEYVLLKLNHDDRSVEVAPRGSHVIKELSKDKSENAVDIQREAYEYMVETSPMQPYASHLQALLQVEENMRHRRKAIQGQLDNSTAVFSLSRFGMFGAQHSGTTGHFTRTPEEIYQEAASLITEGARYKPTIDGIQAKRGHRMNAQAQLYEASKSMSSSIASLSDEGSDSEQSSSAESVTVDDPIYAVGGCAVQVNFGVKDLSQALYLHDQLCPVGPLMLAMTVASPILKGYLIETDGRWNHVSHASDDRSPEEAQMRPRWGTSSMYFEDTPEVQALNTPLTSLHERCDEFTQQLQQAGFSKPLAAYYAHSLTRDPMMNPKAMPGSETAGDLNDRITRLKTHLSTLWPHIRLKLPSCDGSTPWMIEFRSMETQPSDFEIAAMVIFLQFLQKTILHYRLELRVPLDKVDENMSRAQIADAVEEQRFWFNVSNKIPEASSSSSISTSVLELSLDEIFNGQDRSESTPNPYPGLLHYVREYLTTQSQETGLSPSDLDKLKSYISLISRRASGAEPTPAKWMRDFVLNHPDYNGDSQVSHEMYYEMMCKIGERSQIWS